MAAPLVLPKLKKSPTTAQYHFPKPTTEAFYKRRFKFEPEDWKKTVGQPWLQTTSPKMPVYPYGKNNRFPEANEGLYGGAAIRSGNKISKGRNKGKTVRKWFPNVKVKELKSQALRKTLVLPVTARVLRTIDKCGGLDQYLLGDKPARIKELGLLGWKLRWHVMNSPAVKKQFLDERKRLGLPRQEQSFAEAWMDPVKRATLVAKQAEKWQELRDKDETFRQYMQIRLIADGAANTNVPDLKTLSIHDPKEIELPTRVKESRQG